jgi:hypothetical protein
MNQRSAFWNLLLFASVVAACVSLLTTGVGLARYLPAVLAWPLALAVQMGLFGLAWLIAVRHVKLRALVIALYCLTMPFSVVFSYVMLQSEFTSELRPQESQRGLFDDLRQRSATVATEIDESLAESDELQLRLASWLEMEQTQGWTTSSCDVDGHCYLAGVCERVQRRIDTWEGRVQRSYPQGPGQALIYGSLETERSAVQQISDNLRAARQEWGASEQIFEANIDNRERLRRFDLALTKVPQRDLQAVRCDAVALPPAPAYALFARDDALSAETPIYAFEDLARIFDLSHTFTRSDYPTVFALFLAIFIDLFVLLVAVGAAVLEETEPGRPLSTMQPTVPEWSDALCGEISAWIDGALLHARQGVEERRTFLAGLIDTLRFDRGNKVLFVAKDARERRFGFLMTNARAATPSPVAGTDEESVTFVLEDWVYPALTRYLTVPSSG